MATACFNSTGANWQHVGRMLHYSSHTVTSSRRVTYLTESSVLETKAGPNDCHMARFSSIHLAGVSFVLPCFVPIFKRFLKLECVSTMVTNEK